MAKWGRLRYCTAPGCHRPTHLVQPRLSSVCVAGMPLAAAQCCGTGGGVCLSQLLSWTLAQPQAATQVVLYFVINSSAPTSSLCLKWKLFIGRTRGHSYPLLQPARCGHGRGAALQRGVRGAAPVGSGFCSVLALPPGSASPHSQLALLVVRSLVGETGLASITFVLNILRSFHSLLTRCPSPARCRYPQPLVPVDVALGSCTSRAGNRTWNALIQRWNERHLFAH